MSSLAPLALLKPIIISAPFGNWLASPSIATQTIGTYTVQNRAGFLRWWMWWRILRTLRWWPTLGGWTNKLGLPSPGIQHLNNLAYGAAECWRKETIVSVHGFNSMADWKSLIKQAEAFGFVELNMSCPNVGETSIDYGELFHMAMDMHPRVIVKLPPVSWWGMFYMGVERGVKYFHATNTLPTPAGGLSGAPLKAVALDVVRRMHAGYNKNIVIIGGGGIRGPKDAFDFAHAGADHLAVGSTLLSPALWFRGPRERFLKKLADQMVNA